MLFIPYTRFSLQSPASIDACLQRLQTFLYWERPALAQPREDEKESYFQGDILPQGFVVTPKSQYWHPLLPQIVGKLNRAKEGTQIEIVMKMPVYLELICAILIMILFLSIGATVIDHIASGVWNTTIYLVLGIFICGYLVVIGLFSYEADQARDLLEQIFKS